MVGCLTLAHMALVEAGKFDSGAGPATATKPKEAGGCPCCKKGSKMSHTVSIALHFAVVAGAVGLGAIGLIKAFKK